MRRVVLVAQDNAPAGELVASASPRGRVLISDHARPETTTRTIERRKEVERHAGETLSGADRGAGAGAGG